MPQQQKTEPLTYEELPELDERDIKFARHVLEGMTYSDAFRHSRDASNWSNEAIWVESSRLAASPKVRLWIDALRQAAFTGTNVTLETHVRRLSELSARAEGAGNYGAAVQAEVHVGKATGLYVERHEDVGEGRKWTLLDRIFKQHGMTAVLMAGERLGIDPHELQSRFGQSDATH